MSRRRSRRRKRLLLILALVAVLTAVALLGGIAISRQFLPQNCVSQKPDSRPQQRFNSYPKPWDSGKVKLIFFGDNITAGHKILIEDSYACRVAKSLGYPTQYANLGVGGSVLQNTIGINGKPLAGNGRDRYIDIFFADKDGYIFILYGTNDLLYDGDRFSAAEFQHDLGEIVQTLIASGYQPSQIILGSPPFMTAYTTLNKPFNSGSLGKHQQYIEAVRQVATKHGVVYVDLYESIQAQGGDELLLDGINPNPEGHRVIATEFLRAIAR